MLKIIKRITEYDGKIIIEPQECTKVTIDYHNKKFRCSYVATHYFGVENIKLSDWFMMDDSYFQFTTYMITSDNDGHYYVIPVDKTEEWDEFCESPDYENVELPDYADEIGGCSTLVHFPSYEIT